MGDSPQPQQDKTQQAPAPKDMTPPPGNQQMDNLGAAKTASGIVNDGGTDNTGGTDGANAKGSADQSGQKKEQQAPASAGDQSKDKGKEAQGNTTDQKAARQGNVDKQGQQSHQDRQNVTTDNLSSVLKEKGRVGERNEYFNVLPSLINENDKFFTDAEYKNELFISRINDAAEKSGVDRAFLAAALLQENTDKGTYVKPKDKIVFGIAIGVDHWIEKGKSICEIYPDAKNIHFKAEKNQIIDATHEEANDVRFKGDEAVLAFAYYLGNNKERVRKSFNEHGASFDSIPLDDQWAFTRLAMNPGKHIPISKYVNEYLSGHADVPITMKRITSQDSRHPISGATLTVARAKHYRQFFQ